ncbi:MAG: outer membrane lipoprotein-sorting protein [Acidobacteriia bacterium]|nr:outer membrane lipoprotein-sorting protein [Terriglobia bacterium]
MKSTSCGVVSLLIILTFSAGGCVSKNRKVAPTERPKPAQTATLSDLVDQFNHQVDSYHSFQAKVRFDLRSGSLKSGELKDYHEIKGFILLRRPSHLRMIGQIPTFGINALDMVSDGKEFRVAFAPYRKFVMGSAIDRPHSSKPLENLRPWHILEIVAVQKLAPASNTHWVFREEVSEGRDNYYVLYDVERGAHENPYLNRKIWIDRSDLRFFRQQVFSSEGMLESDARYEDYSDWNGIAFPKKVSYFRPPEDYGLTIWFDDIRFNLTLEDSKFTLEKPEGYELVEVGKNSKAP